MKTSEEGFRVALTNASRAYKARSAHDLTTVGVHAGQNFLLEALLAEDNLTTGELARRLHIEDPTASRMIHRMEAVGLVVRKPDPNDGRRIRVALTLKGQETAVLLPALLDAVSTQALQHMPPVERDTLIELLRRVATNLEWNDVP